MEILSWTVITLFIIVLVLGGFLYLLFLAHCKTEEIRRQEDSNLRAQRSSGSELRLAQLAEVGPWPMILDMAGSLTSERQLAEFQQYIARTYPLIHNDPDQWERVLSAIRIRNNAIQKWRVN